MGMTNPINKYNEPLLNSNGKLVGECYTTTQLTRSSAIAEGLGEALVSRNPATTKHLT